MSGVCLCSLYIHSIYIHSTTIIYIHSIYYNLHS